MKFFLDFFPVLAFFISYKFYDIYIATAVLIVASFVQTLGHWLLKKKFEKLHVMTLIVSVVMGGMTIIFRDEAFIKWKVSVVYWLMCALIVVFWLRKKNALQMLFEGLMQQPLAIGDKLWSKINIAWGLCLLTLGVINIWIAYSFSLDTWVNFKVWGTLIIQFVLMLATFLIVFKNLPEKDNEALHKQDDLSGDQ